MAYAATNANDGIVARLNVIVANIADRIARRRIYNNTLRELSQLSGRELADLGLHRSQLKRIAFEAAYNQ